MDRRPVVGLRFPADQDPDRPAGLPDLTVSDGELLAPDFDYWLYVVEKQPDGNLGVLALRNIARRAAHFALHGGSWRHDAEQTTETTVA